MNQILFTGDEGPEKKQKEQYINTKKQKAPNFNPIAQNNYTSKKVVGINKIVIFFSISIIILGFCLIGGSIYAKEQINEEVEANATPLVNIIRNDDNNTLEIEVEHIRGITKIEYWWNAEEPTVINGNNQTRISETIELLGGTNTLTIQITEENGQTVKYNKQYTVSNIPTIELEAVSNGVKIISYAEDIIDYITYSWDEGEETTIEVGDQNYEGVISAPKGRHSLKITVVDQQGIPAEKTTTVIGATVPVIKVQLGKKDDGLYFVINIQDEDNLKNVKITLNDQEAENIEVNDKTYYAEIKLEDGENRLMIEAENSNGLTATEKKSFDTNSLKQ